MPKVDPTVSLTSLERRYLQIVKPKLDVDSLTLERLLEIESLPDIKAELDAAAIDLALLRKSGEGIFLARMKNGLNSEFSGGNTAKIENTTSEKYESLHKSVCILTKNLNNEPVSEENFLETLKKLSEANNDSSDTKELRKAFTEIDVKLDSDSALQEASRILNAHWQEFHETINIINRLAEHPEEIDNHGVDLDKHLKKARYLDEYKEHTVHSYFLNDLDLMNQFFTNGFIVFKAFYGEEVDKDLTEAQYRSQSSQSAFFKSIENARKEKKLSNERAAANVKSPDSGKGFWKGWGNWLITGAGVLAFIGAFLTGSEDSKLGKIIAGLGLGAVVGGLVAKFHKYISWVFGVEEGVKPQVKPVVASQAETVTAIGGVK